MSKRFGRNQKRRLKAQLAQEQREIEAERKRHARTMNRLEHAESVINDVANVLGPHFIGLPPDKKNTAEMDHIASRWEMAGYTPVDRFLPSFNEDMQSAVQDTIRILDMYRVGPVSAQRDEMRMMTHVLASVGNQAVAYGVSDHALRKAPLPYMSSLISQGMADEVLKALRNRR